MYRNFVAGVSAVAVMGFAGAAMARPDRQPELRSARAHRRPARSLACGPATTNITLTMDGTDGNNSATAGFDAQPHQQRRRQGRCTVDGTLPAPTSRAAGINFFIFNGTDAATAVNAITANAYSPAGALVWNDGTSATRQTVLPQCAENTSTPARRSMPRPRPADFRAGPSTT